MISLPRRSLLAIAAVVDVALHGRTAPVAAKAVSDRQNLPPRHLETVLQALVRAKILKGTRGPRGGYALALERRRITVAAIVRATSTSEDAAPEPPASPVLAPMLTRLGEIVLGELEAITVEDLCRGQPVTEDPPNFTI